jgi:hypothetical protein
VNNPLANSLIRAETGEARSTVIRDQSSRAGQDVAADEKKQGSWKWAGGPRE